MDVKFFNLQNFRFEIFSCKAPWAYGYGAIEILIIIIIIIIIITSHILKSIYRKHQKCGSQCTWLVRKVVHVENLDTIIVIWCCSFSFLYFRLSVGLAVWWWPRTVELNKYKLGDGDYIDPVVCVW